MAARRSSRIVEGLVVVAPLLPGLERAKHGDPAVGRGLVGDSFECVKELGPSPLARLGTVERSQRAARVGVSKVERDEHRRTGLDGADGLSHLLARGRRRSFAHRGSQGEPALDPRRRKLNGLVECRLTRLEDSTRDGVRLEHPGGDHRRQRAGLVLGPLTKGVEMKLKIRALRGRRDPDEDLVERTRPTLVATKRELAHGVAQRIVPGRAKDVGRHLSRFCEVEPPDHPFEPAVDRVGPKMPHGVRHLAVFDPSETRFAVAARARAQKEIVDRPGELVVRQRRLRHRGFGAARARGRGGRSATARRRKDPKHADRRSRRPPPQAPRPGHPTHETHGPLKCYGERVDSRLLSQGSGAARARTARASESDRLVLRMRRERPRGSPESRDWSMDPRTARCRPRCLRRDGTGGGPRARRRRRACRSRCQ